ncbi:MAG: endonuclease/exonuclease/phosphatase family protein [Candidatus Caenarcaniphilales bacterium]|nr:endonuclease/exonuclease/phosphatase family protein [Candidatus Caenarcaniphilales bacterium]
MLFYLYIIVASGLLAAGFLLGDAYWWLALVNSFRYWLFLPLIIFWIEHLWIGLEKIPGIFLVTLTGLWIYFYIWFPFYEGLDKKDATAQTGPQVKVMSFNLLYKNQNLDKVISTIQSEAPDIVALQETTQSNATVIKDKLAKDYPYASFHSKKEIIGVSTFSKFPIESDAYIPTKVGYSELVKIKHPSREFYLVNVHTESIDPLDLFGNTKNILRAYKDREQMLKDIIDSLKESSIPLNNSIIVGDFNSTDGNYLYRIMKSYGYKDSYREVNSILPSAFTFPNNVEGLLNRQGKFFPIIRIDFIYTGLSFKPIKSEVIDTETGSDHKPLVSVLGFV